MKDSDYQITVAMSDDTVDALYRKGLTLYGFKAVQTTARAAPLIWFKSATFMDTLMLSWTERYQVYTSNSVVIPGRPVAIGSSYPIALGDALTITRPNGTGVIASSIGTPDAITIDNEASIEFTCGISQAQPYGSVMPVCAFPLFSGAAQAVAPIEQILLLFSTTRLNVGTVMEQSNGAGLMIDLTASNNRTVCFDIDTGWSWGRGIWARPVPPNSNLVPLLVQSPPALARRRIVGLRA